MLVINVYVIFLIKPTGLVVQRDDSVLVDFGHVVNDVLWVYVTLVQDLIERRETQNPLQAEKFRHKQRLQQKVLLYLSSNDQKKCVLVIHFDRIMKYAVNESKGFQLSVCVCLYWVRVMSLQMSCSSSIVSSRLGTCCSPIG